MFEINTEVKVILFLTGIFLLLFLLLYRILTDKNKGSGGFITTAASTYDLQTKDQRAAVQEIAEIKSHKKLEEEKSSDTNPEGKIKDE